MTSLANVSCRYLVQRLYLPCFRGTIESSMSRLYTHTKNSCRAHNWRICLRVITQMRWVTTCALWLASTVIYREIDAATRIPMMSHAIASPRDDAMSSRRKMRSLSLFSDREIPVSQSGGIIPRRESGSSHPSLSRNNRDRKINPLILAMKGVSRNIPLLEKIF